MKKHVGKILALAMAVVFLAGCGGNAGSDEPAPTLPPVDVAQNSEDNGENNGNDEYEFTRQVDAGFRETLMDLGGRELVIATTSFNVYNYWDPIDTTPNETLELIARLREIEDDYNMTFRFENAANAGALVQQVLMNRIAGDTPIDIVNFGTNQTAPDAIFQQDVEAEITVYKENQGAFANMCLLKMEGLEAVPTDDLYTETPSILKPKQLTAIPYFAWANRGLTEMRVWINETV